MTQKEEVISGQEIGCIAVVIRKPELLAKKDKKGEDL